MFEDGNMSLGTYNTVYEYFKPLMFSEKQMRKVRAPMRPTVRTLGDPTQKIAMLSHVVKCMAGDLHVSVF